MFKCLGVFFITCANKKKINQAKVEFYEWMDEACSGVAVSSEGSGTAAFHFTGSENSSSVHSFNTYLP